jgi:hypothetical protein
MHKLLKPSSPLSGIDGRRDGKERVTGRAHADITEVFWIFAPWRGHSEPSCPPSPSPSLPQHRSGLVLSLGGTFAFRLPTSTVLLFIAFPFLCSSELG